jgi:prophage antirepressor-like protein
MGRCLQAGRDKKITLVITEGKHRGTAGVGIADGSSNGSETATLGNTEGSSDGIGMSGISQARGVTFITEAGLYSLMLTSRSPRAKVFRRWVTHEVLRAIREDGKYVMGEEKVRNGRAVAEMVPKRY